MRHQVFGRKLGRNSGERKALFRGLAQALVLRGGIITTEAKAKAIKGLVEKLVTKAKKDKKQMLFDFFQNNETVDFLIKKIAPRMMSRVGGYTRIVSLGQRKGDGAEMVKMDWMEAKAASDGAKSVKEPALADTKKTFTPAKTKQPAAKTAKTKTISQKTK